MAVKRAVSLRIGDRFRIPAGPDRGRYAVALGEPRASRFAYDVPVRLEPVTITLDHREEVDVKETGGWTSPDHFRQRAFKILDGDGSAADQLQALYELKGKYEGTA